MAKPRFLFCTFYVLLVLLSSVTSKKSNNYAIIVNSSKFWFNYRQTANSLLIYHYLREHGIPDSNILIMNPDNIACNCRNNDPGSVTAFDGKYEPNLFKGAETDFRKDDVSLPNILGALRSRFDPRTPLKKRLILDENSKVLIYLNGHGGDNYWKIQDTLAIMHYDFAKAVEELHAKKGYKEMLVMSDSCAAFTVFDLLDTPNLVMIGSSSQGEKSYSQGRDKLLDLAKTDMFSADTEEFMRRHGDKATVQQLFDSYNAVRLMGTPAIRWTHTKKKPSSILAKEYFSSENTWNPDLVDFRKNSTVAKPEIDYYSGILQSLKDVPAGNEKIDYARGNPIRDILEDSPLDFSSFSF